MRLPSAYCEVLGWRIRHSGAAASKAGSWALEPASGDRAERIAAGLARGDDLESRPIWPGSARCRAPAIASCLTASVSFDRDPAGHRSVLAALPGTLVPESGH